MGEWLSANAWAVWLGAAALLAIAETLSLDFTLLMLAAGALAGAGAAVLFPGLWLVHAIVAAVVAFAMLFLLRPTLLQKIRNMPGYRSSLQRMVGGSGRAISAITATSGEVKVEGEVWHARSYDGSDIPDGAAVEIYEVEGTTVVVYPKDA